MGFLWLGVGPLISGAVVEMFGLRWQAMIQGVAFMSHQIGSFLGALGAGLLFDLMGNYDLTWKLGVGSASSPARCSSSSRRRDRRRDWSLGRALARVVRCEFS